MRTRLVLLLLLSLAGCPAPGDMMGAMDLSTADALPSGACTTELPCRMGICLGVGGFAGCGACRMADPMEVCQKDDDCKPRGAGHICSAAATDCLCRSELLCRAGCTKGSCGEGQECGADLRCAGKTCTADADCPTHFACSLGKRCERATCRTSAECDGGSCVGGLCQASPGRCTLPPP